MVRWWYGGGTVVVRVVVRGEVRRVVRWWTEGGRGWYEGGTVVERSWYEGGTRARRGWYARWHLDHRCADHRLRSVVRGGRVKVQFVVGLRLHRGLRQTVDDVRHVIADDRELKRRRKMLKKEGKSGDPGTKSDGKHHTMHPLDG